MPRPKPYPKPKRLWWRTLLTILLWPWLAAVKVREWVYRQKR